MIKVLYPYRDFSGKSISRYLEGLDNIGNMVYLDLILSHMDVAPLYTQDLYSAPSLAREGCDILILPFSNMLSPSFSARGLIDILEEYDFNVVLLSIGIQAEEFQDLDSVAISEDAQKLLSLSVSKGFVVGARGEDSSFVLRKYGVPHRVIGCPSALIDFKKRLTAPEFGEGDIFAVNTTLTGDNRDRCRNILKLFVNNPSIYFLQSENRIVADIFNIKVSDVFSDGVAPNGFEFMNSLDYEYGYYCPDGVDRYFVQKAFRSRGFFDLDIERWKTNIRRCAFSVGSRFHGNMLACHEGIPSLFVRFDRRTNELIDYHKLPCVDLVPDTVSDVVDNIDYTDYYSVLSDNRKVFNDFLMINSIPSMSM